MVGVVAAGQTEFDEEIGDNMVWGGVGFDQLRVQAQCFHGEHPGIDECAIYGVWIYGWCDDSLWLTGTTALWSRRIVWFFSLAFAWFEGGGVDEGRHFLFYEGLDVM